MLPRAVTRVGLLATFDSPTIVMALWQSRGRRKGAVDEFKEAIYIFHTLIFYFFTISLLLPTCCMITLCMSCKLIHVFSYCDVSVAYNKRIYTTPVINVDCRVL